MPCENRPDPEPYQGPATASTPWRAVRRCAARRATPADIDALWALEQSAFSGDRLSPRSWRALVASESALVTVVDGDNALLGAAVVLRRARARTARLYSLAVAPAARREGLGRRLLATAIASARAAGCARLRLEVRPDNPAAEALYRNSGFLPIGRKRAFYGDGADALCFELPLDVASLAANRQRGGSR